MESSGGAGLDNDISLNLGQLLWGRSLVGVIEGPRFRTCSSRG